MDYQPLIINLKKRIISARKHKKCTSTQAATAWYFVEKFKGKKTIGENLVMMLYLVSFYGEALTYSDILEEFIAFGMSSKKEDISA